MKQKIAILIKNLIILLICSFILVQAVSTKSSCKERNPSFFIKPTTQKGQAGATLTYNLYIKNNDINCSPRSFLITGKSPLVNGEMWDMHFYIYGASRYPDGDRRSNFVLDSQESPIVKMDVTSKTTWPSGTYLHYSYLNYGKPGDEINLVYNIERRWIYNIVPSKNKKIIYYSY